MSSLDLPSMQPAYTDSYTLSLHDALPILAHDVLPRNVDAVHEDLVVVDLPGEAADRADVHAGQAIVDHQHAEPAVPARRGIGAREHGAVGRDPRVARPDLAAVQHPVIAVEPRASLEREQVRSRARLAVALPECRLAAGDLRQDLALQGGRSVADDRLRDLEAAGELADRPPGAGQRP